MIRHIEFCLDEIECEIDAQDISGLAEPGRLSLQRHIAQMRIVLANWKATAEAGATIAGAETSQAEIGDKLEWIRGIDRATAELLASNGVTRFQTIADWRHEEIAALGGETLGLERIAEENWIEQAAILVTGQLTLHAKQVELANIANAEVVAVAIADTVIEAVIEAGTVAIAKAANIASPQGITITTARDATATNVAMAHEPDTTADNIIPLGPARRTSVGRRIAQAAAALAIIAAGIGALNGWDLASIAAITAALAEQTQIR